MSQVLPYAKINIDETVNLAEIITTKTIPKLDSLWKLFQNTQILPPKKISFFQSAQKKNN